MFTSAHRPLPAAPSSSPARRVAAGAAVLATVLAVGGAASSAHAETPPALPPAPPLPNLPVPTGGAPTAQSPTQTAQSPTQTAPAPVVAVPKAPATQDAPAPVTAPAAPELTAPEAPGSDSAAPAPGADAAEPRRPRTRLVLGGRLEGSALRLTVSCTAGGALTLRRSGTVIARAGARCVQGRASVRLRLPARIARSLRAGHPLRATLALAAGGTRRQQGLRVAASRRRSTVRAASWSASGVNNLCFGSGSGSGGLQSVSVAQSEGFGVAGLNEQIYVKVALWAYANGAWTGPYLSDWLSYTVVNPATVGAYTDPNTGMFVIGGTEVPGSSTFVPWSGYNAIRVPAGLWTASALYTWTARTGYHGDWLNAEAQAPAFASGFYCHYQ